MTAADGSAQVAEIMAGYTFAGPSVHLGAALVDGEVHPEAPVRLPLAMMNRHGLVAGATGTGKTITLQVMAEQLSAQGVPVFLADIKGDLTGLSTPGTGTEKLLSRTQSVGQQWAAKSFPVEYFSLGGHGVGIPVRATISAFGPLLLSRVMDLNETQASSLTLVFHYADQSGLELFNLADLRAVISFLTSDEGKPALKDLGGLSKATAGVILRELITLQAQGMDVFFGEPEFDTADLLRLADDGRGMISCLELPTLLQTPQLFSTFLMWLVADLFSDLPEVGDQEKPKLVFFLDEAHLLFTGASKEFLQSIQTTVRLIRSKGIGIFFVTQTPKDVPAEVLGQLANRVQHALRAFTPDDAKALKATVSTFPTSSYDLSKVLTSAGTGEAVVTVMNDRGAPTPVAWTRMTSPESTMGPSAPGVVERIVGLSALSARYGSAVDSHSAFEKLTASPSPDQPPAAPGPDAEAQRIEDSILGTPRQPPPTTAPTPDRRSPSRPAPELRGQRDQADDLMDIAVKAAGTIGAEIARGLFGTQRRRSRRRW
ncbi:helicase HerA-like domain-containing protein [Arthrobacter sp. CAN_A1]|uniref:helicase HerA-like domain-containing protein n=1 Tax=Arthrobacter sp. CAN_A1 TaxID=2787717 RepID=UPI0018C93598